MPHRLAIAIALAVLAVSTPARADKATSLTLGQVLSAAVRQNPDLARASVDIARANAAAFEATGIDDWLLAASIGAFVERNESVAGNVTGTDSVDVYSVRTELSRLLDTGGRFGISFNGRRRKTIFTVVGDQENRDYSGSLALNFEQPLLRGRGAKVARGSVKQAKLSTDAETLRREAQVRDLVRQVIHGFWDVALAWEQLEIRRSALQLASERRRITTAAIDAGTVAPTEALSVEQIIATREETILNAELNITQQSLDLRRLAFLEIGARAIDLKPSAVLKTTTRAFDESALIKRAMTNSPEIAALARQGEGARIEVAVTENGMLPRLDLSLSFGPTATDSTFLNAAERLGRLRGYSVTAGLSYEQRLENRSARGGAARARAQMRRIEVDRRAVEQQIALAVARAVKVANFARRRMQLGERTIALAQRNIEAEKARFELGRATNFDVLQRQDELQQAQLRYASATVDFLKAEATIDSLTGDILDKYGIKVAK
ncbi:MAG: TolC family protein [Deltaproteobacteria bacterium]|nr:TolC family protein [Deltaproteobacteria bacterium]